MQFVYPSSYDAQPSTFKSLNGGEEASVEVKEPVQKSSSQSTADRSKTRKERRNRDFVARIFSAIHY